MAPSESETSSRKALARDREYRALALRIDGKQYEEIGALLGITRQAAHAAVKRVMERTEQDAADLAAEYRRLHLDRTEEALAAIKSQVKVGDYSAIDRLLGIAEFQAKLLGTFAPTRQQSAVSLEVTDYRGELADRLNRLSAAGATSGVSGEPARERGE